MTSIFNTIQKRRKQTYEKLRQRFVRSLKSGQFKHRSRQFKSKSIERLKHLEAQLGLQSNLKLGHWALAATLGFVTTISQAQDERGKLGQKKKKPTILNPGSNGESILGTQAIPLFSEQPFLGDPWISEDVYTADFDGDGDLDLLVYSYYGPTRIFENDGAGNFPLSSTLYTFTGGVEGLGIADIDEDGDLDIVIAEGVAPNSNRLHAFKNDGTATFARTDQLLADTDFDKILFADIDNDGDFDIVDRVYIYQVGSRVIVFDNDSTGFFAPTDTLNWYNDIVLGDFDSDSDVDIGSATGSEFRVFTNDGTGNFDNASYISTIVSGFFDELTSGDVDGINGDDVIYTDQDKVIWLQNDGAGMFTKDTLINRLEPKYVNFNNPSLSDVDGDGDLDIIAIEQYDNFVTQVQADSSVILLNNGAGSFTEIKEYFSPNVLDPDNVVSFDADGDGDGDLIVSNYFDVVTYHNDGNENFTKFEEDLIQVVYGLGAALVDVDGDGDIDAINSGLTQILKNDGLGNFTVSQDIVRDTDLVAAGVDAGDFDGDGDIDAVFTSYEFNDKPRIWSNDGTGLFTETSQLPMDSADVFYKVRTADIDDDGDLDLVGGGYNPFQSQNIVNIWTNDGSGNFSVADESNPSQSIDGVKAADLTGDFVPDIIASGDQGIFIYDFNSDSLNSPQLYLDTATFFNYEFSAIGDIDGDGDNDILIFNGYAFGGSGDHFEMINDGTGSFTVNTLAVSTMNYGGAVLGDFDLDGDQELFIGGGESFTDEFWENDGLGNFSLVGNLDAVSYNPNVGDLDGDGDLDIFSNQYYQSSFVIENTTNTPVLDTTPPTVGIDILATNDPTPPLSGTTDDPTATVSVTVDGTTYSATNNGDGTWSIADGVLDSLADGQYDAALEAEDPSSNITQDTVVNALTIDTTSPIVSTDGLSTNDTTPALSGTIDDTGATLTVTIDGTTYGATNNGDGTWGLADNTVAALNDGFYDVAIAATDAVGNVRNDTTTNAVFVDATAPIVTVDPLTDFDTTPELTGTIDDNAASITVDVDIYSEPATNNGDGTWTLVDNTLGALALGTYDVIVTATDSLGNVSNDATADELEIIVNPGRALDSAALADIYTATDGVNWTDNTNWTTGPLETWSGITVSADRVVSVALNSNNLQGTFPLITTGLDAVLDLDISNNELVDVSDLSSLTALLNVDVRDNRLQFTTLSTLLGGGYTLFYDTQKTVLTPIQILLQVGENYVLDRTVAGADAYSWFKDGSPLTETTSSFEITGLATTDDAVYFVQTTSTSVPGLTLQSTGIDLRISSLERDEKSLRIVYESLEENSGLTDWSTTGVTDWDAAGEVTIESNRVTSLNLANSGLTGELSDDILDLEDLITVDVSNNELTKIPDVSSLSNLTSFDASQNPLDFGSIEPNVGNPVTFDNLKPFGTASFRIVAKDSDVAIEIPVGGDSNSYQWVFRNDSLPETNQDFSNVSGATDATYNLNAISYLSMGSYKLQVTNSQSPIAIESEPQEVLAFGSIQFTPVFEFKDGFQGTLKQGESKLFKITESGPFIGVDTVNVTNESIVFDSVILGDYILNVRTEPDYQEIKDVGGGDIDTVQFIPTYFESTIDWVEADTLRLRDFLSDELTIQRVPPPTVGEGEIALLVESDFEDDPGGRLEARRRVQKAGCSLRRRTTGGGGRPQQDDEFVLIAYKETDENGEVNFGTLPEGTYRLNIQYPGIPMDPDSFVEFIIDPNEGIGGYELAATITEEGIVVEQILGLKSDYFKDLNVYPVPASDKVTIAYKRLLLENVKFHMTDLNGKVLMVETLETGIDQKLEVDVSGIKGGIYILQFFDNSNGILAKYKVIVTK